MGEIYLNEKIYDLFTRYNSYVVIALPHDISELRRIFSDTSCLYTHFMLTGHNNREIFDYLHTVYPEEFNMWDVPYTRELIIN
jgi:ABC-type Mn2+/Zn2+ transport system ATPase subunit